VAFHNPKEGRSGIGLTKEHTLPENEHDDNNNLDDDAKGQEPKVDEEDGANEDESGKDDVDGDEGVEGLPEWAQKVIKDLRTENASRRSKAITLQEQLNAAKTPEEFEAASTAFKDTVLELERKLVAVSFDLPDELAERLKGSTREELEEDAKKLQKFSTARKPQRRPSGGLDPADDADNSDVEAAVASVLRRGKTL